MKDQNDESADLSRQCCWISNHLYINIESMDISYFVDSGFSVLVK